MFKLIFSGTIQKATKTYLRNFNTSNKPRDYLNTVLNIKFMFESEEISGDLLLPNNSPEPSTLNHKVESRVLEFVKRHGFTAPKDIERVSGASYYAITACPNLTLEQYEITANVAAGHLLFDSIFDDQLLDARYIEVIQLMCGKLCGYFRCNVLPINEEIHEVSPKFENICRMYFDLGKSLLETGRDLSYIYQGFDILVEGYVTQVTQPRPKSAEEYLQRKVLNFGMQFYFDLTCTLAGESLSTDVRNSTWFRNFQAVTASLPALMFEPMSITYDITRGKDRDNYTIILMEQGYSLKEAFNKTIIRYNSLVIETLLLILQLEQISVSEADRRYLRLYLSCVKGGFNWVMNYIPYNNQSMMKHRLIQDEKRTSNCLKDVLRAVPML